MHLQTWKIMSHLHAYHRDDVKVLRKMIVKWNEIPCIKSTCETINKSPDPQSDLPSPPSEEWVSETERRQVANGVLHNMRHSQLDYTHSGIYIFTYSTLPVISRMRNIIPIVCLSRCQTHRETVLSVCLPPYLAGEFLICHRAIRRRKNNSIRLLNSIRSKRGLFETVYYNCSGIRIKCESIKSSTHLLPLPMSVLNGWHG